MTETCPSEDTLSALADIELAGAERAADGCAAVQAHCARCPQCAARLGTLRALHAAFDALPPLAPDVDLSRQVLARIEAERRRPAPSPSLPAQTGWQPRLREFARLLSNWPNATLPYAGAGAAVLIGLWLGGMLLQGNDAQQPSAPTGMLLAMSVFDAIPPGNLCPPARTCGATGNAQ